MPRTLDQMELGFGPGLVQREGVPRRARHVVATVHDRARNARQPPGIAQQLALFQPGIMREEVIFDPREGQCEMPVLKRLAQRGVG